MAASSTRRRALVLGASSDIGLRVCERYLSAGYDVMGHYRTNDSAFDSVRAMAGRFDSVHCDLSDLDAVADLARAVGPVDALVFLAADASPTRLEDADPAAWRRALDVGTLSTYVMTGVIGPTMAERGWGRIVIGSSIGVKFGGGADSFAYALANHASEFLPRSVRAWVADGVLTNVVRIGVTDTKLHAAFPGRDLTARAALIPMRRPATVDEIADFVFWHGSELNTYVTGQVVAISGGE